MNKFIPTILKIKGIGKVKGVSYDGRVSQSEYPENTYGYYLRHGDDGDFTDICSIKNGYIMVNCYGMFFTEEPLAMLDGEELEVTKYRIDYD